MVKRGGVEEMCSLLLLVAQEEHQKVQHSGVKRPLTGEERALPSEVKTSFTSLLLLQSAGFYKCSTLAFYMCSTGGGQLLFLVQQDWLLLMQAFPTCYAQCCMADV